MKAIKNNTAIIILAAVTLLLMQRAVYSFCYSDESFYFATANRFLQGDYIFVNDWFPTQLVSLIIMPFMWVYQVVTGGNDGIILYFRELYCIVTLLFSILVYKILSRYYLKTISFFAALYVLLYAHLNITTINYYMMSVWCFLLALLFIFDAVLQKKSLKKKKTSCFISGIFLALSVLSLPSLAAAYFLTAGFIVLLIWPGSLILKNTKLNIPVRELKMLFIWNLSGIIVTAVPVLIYILPTTGLTGIVYNIGYVLSDEEHATSLIFPLKNFYLSVFAVFGKKQVLSTVFLCIASLITANPPAWQKESFKKLRGLVSALIIACDFLLYIYFTFKGFFHTGFMGTAFLLFSVPVFLLIPLREMRTEHRVLFALTFFPGLVFSLTYSYSSLCDLYVLSIGHQIGAIGGILLSAAAFNYLIKNRCFHTLTRVICLAAILLLIISAGHNRLYNVYRDAPLASLTEKITEGPAKGLYTTKDHKAEYDTLLSLIREYDDGGNVFFTKLLPWGYLATSSKCAAHTTWRTPADSPRLKQYHAEQPKKVPTVIFFLKPEIGSYEKCGDVEADPNPNENELKGYLHELINKGNYSVKNTSIGTIYHQK